MMDNPAVSLRATGPALIEKWDAMGADVYLLLLRGFRLQKEDAEDLAQELRLFCFRKGIDATDPRTWGRLRKVAGWLVARHHRRRVREVSLSEMEELEDSSAGVAMDQREVRVWFAQVCEQAGLRKKDQEFFWLCGVEGYSHREAAEAVGWSARSGTVHFHRILKRLRGVAGGPHKSPRGVSKKGDLGKVGAEDGGNRS